MTYLMPNSNNLMLPGKNARLSSAKKEQQNNSGGII